MVCVWGRHLLVVFGGLKGLEYSLDCDEQLTVADVSLLFDHYLNTCPHQGSRTIRTEVRGQSAKFSYRVYSVCKSSGELV